MSELGSKINPLNIAIKVLLTKVIEMVHLFLN
jgi:hypothetical protein